MHINDILDLPSLQAVIRRFEAKFIRAGEDDCWEWTAAKMARGYGKMLVMGKLRGAHQLAYLFNKGAIPNTGRFRGATLCRHTCDNPGCVNPKHIILGAQVENTQDAHDRGRKMRGQDTSFSKLTDEQVQAIRADTRYQRDIAADYGIAQGQVCRIKRRQRWKHLA